MKVYFRKTEDRQLGCFLFEGAELPTPADAIQAVKQQLLTDAIQTTGPVLALIENA